MSDILSEIEKREKEREHQEKMARMAHRRSAFEKSPFWFTLWDVTVRTLEVVLWLGFWLLVAQCSCDGCIL